VAAHEETTTRAGKPASGRGHTQGCVCSRTYLLVHHRGPVPTRRVGYDGHRPEQRRCGPATDALSGIGQAALPAAGASSSCVLAIRLVGRVRADDDSATARTLPCRWPLKGPAAGVFGDVNRRCQTPTVFDLGDGHPVDRVFTAVRLGGGGALPHVPDTALGHAIGSKTGDRLSVGWYSWREMTASDRNCGEGHHCVVGGVILCGVCYSAYQFWDTVRGRWRRTWLGHRAARVGLRRGAIALGTGCPVWNLVQSHLLQGRNHAPARSLSTRVAGSSARGRAGGVSHRCVARAPAQTEKKLRLFGIRMRAVPPNGIR